LTHNLTQSLFKAPTGYSYVHMYVSGVNSKYSNRTKYFAQTMRPIFTFWKISTAHLRIVWHQWNYKMFIAL